MKNNTKKILACLCLVMVMIPLFAACNEGEVKDEVSEISQTESVLQDETVGNSSVTTASKSVSEEQDTQSKASQPSTEQGTAGLLKLKKGEIKSLVGFNFGDKVDLNIVKNSGKSTSGSDIYLLKDGSNDDLSMLFANGFFGLMAVGKGNFYGIQLGKDEPQKLYDILGKPDSFEEISGTSGKPLAVFAMKNATMYVEMNKKNKIDYILYKGE